MRKVFLSLTFIIVLPFSIFAYTSIKIKAMRIDNPPKIDGLLNDPVWKKAIPYTNFIMQEPHYGQKPSEKTELRVLYDKNNLYIGIMCYDSEPQKIGANEFKWDNRGRASDVVKIIIDPFQDKRNGYVFFVNAKGVRTDGLAFGEYFSTNWDGIWDAKAKILKNGWSVEIKIPFKSIGFNPKLSSWGFNVERYIPRKMEKIRLSSTSKNSFFYNPMEGGLLEGLEGIKQGIGLTVRPYIKASTSYNIEYNEERDYTGDIGVDLYKNFTPNLTGIASINTDFAETEADERRLNMTRFPLFFPEKRGFFLEGSDIFSFGIGLSPHRGFVPFYSRRIGLYEGEQIPIIFGAKLLGKIKNTNIGILDVVTDEYTTYEGIELERKNFLVARVYQNIWSESKIGFIYTNGTPEPGEENSLAGVDFTYSTSKLFGNKNFALGGWYIYNWNDFNEGSHQAYGFKIDYPNDLIDTMVTYTYLGDSFNPGLGFLMRNGVKSLMGGIAYQPRPEKGLIGKLVRQFFFEFYGSFYWDLNGVLETRRFFTAPINLRTESGEHIEFNVMPNYDRLPYDFEISEGVVIPQGEYNFLRYRFEGNSAKHRPVFFDFSWRFGDYYSGKLDEYEIGLTLLYKWLSVRVETEMARGDMPEGEFSENVYRLRGEFVFSPDIYLLSYIQYDDVSDTIGANIIFKWRISPGNTLFFVLNKGWEKEWDPVERFSPYGDEYSVKLLLSIRP